MAKTDQPQQMMDISYNGESSEIMVRYPNGRIEFMGTWEAVKLLWSIVWARPKVKFKVRINGEVL